MTTTTIAKWGNSYAVRLPSAEIKKHRLKAGTKVHVRTSNFGTFTLVPAKATVPSMRELLRKMKKIHISLKIGDNQSGKRYGSTGTR